MSNERPEEDDRPPVEDSTEPSGADPAASEPDARRASEDLAEGLEFMLRAARKAVRGIDTRRLEHLGQRARRTLEELNPKKVEQFGRKAAEKLDPRRIEEVAEEAGRELLSVVERVTDRVEKIVGAAGIRRPRSVPPEADGDAAGADAERSDGAGDEAEAAPSRVRVED